jgi:flagellar motor switch protein FliN
MTEVLSQDDIDQLLTVISEEDTGEQEVTQRKNIKIYDFQRPDILTKKDLTKLNDIFQRYSFLIHMEIQELLGEKYQCNLCSIDQLTYEEFTRSIPSVSRVYRALNDRLKYIIIELDKNLADIPQDNLFKNLPNLGGCTAGHKDYTTEYRFYEERHEMICLFTFEICSEELEGLFTICIPAKELSKWLHKNELKENNMKFDKDAIKTNIEASLGKAEISIGDVGELGEGSIIELDRNVGDAVPVFVDGKQIGLGEVVLVDEKFGVRLVEVFK